MSKRDFFYKPSIVEDWLVDYKDALEIDLKSVQPYVSLWLNDKDLPDEAAHWFQIVSAAALSYPWAFCDPPERVEDLSPKSFWFEVLQPPVSATTWRSLKTRPVSDGKMRELQGLLDDYRERLRKACAIQADDWVLMSAYRMSEHPDFIGYIKSVQGVWVALEQVPSYSQPEQVVTVTRNLQEVVYGMEVNKAIATAARAHALAQVELTFPDLKTCAITYDVEVTDDDRAWAEGWYRRCIADGWPLVPEPFLGLRMTQVAVRDRYIKTENPVLHIRYREEQEVEWKGRVYRFGLWKITGIERDGAWVEPTQDDLDMIETGMTLRDADDLTKEQLWPIWRDNMLMQGVAGFEKKRDMRPGEEQELLARFEEHWDRIETGNAAMRARKQVEIDERRAEVKATAEEARRLSDQMRNIRTLT